jgi:hypothetical protein
MELDICSVPEVRMTQPWKGNLLARSQAHQVEDEE